MSAYDFSSKTVRWVYIEDPKLGVDHFTFSDVMIPPRSESEAAQNFTRNLNWLVAAKTGEDYPGKDWDFVRSSPPPMRRILTPSASFSALDQWPQGVGRTSHLSTSSLASHENGFHEGGRPSYGDLMSSPPDQWPQGGGKTGHPTSASSSPPDQWPQGGGRTRHPSTSSCLSTSSLTSPKNSQRAPHKNGRRPILGTSELADDRLIPVTTAKLAPVTSPIKTVLCTFCKSNGEMPEFYTTHKLKDPWGRVICPVLSKYVCPTCQATGDEAHTLKYCPNRP